MLVCMTMARWKYGSARLSVLFPGCQAQHQLLDATGIQLSQQILAVCLYGPRADVQLSGNLLAGQAREYLSEHLPFPVCQGREPLLHVIRCTG